MHDPGGKTKHKLPEGTTGHAIYADQKGRQQVHRPALWRMWNGVEFDAANLVFWKPGVIGDVIPYVLYIGLNPSVATHDINDPTINRETAFAKSWNYDAFCKMNVMDYRATNPTSLTLAAANGYRLQSPGMLDLMQTMASRADRIVVCWGAVDRRFNGHVNDVLKVLEPFPKWCFGETLRGHPKHPLYLKGDTKLVEFMKV